MTTDYTSEVVVTVLSDLAWRRVGGVDGLFDVWEDDGSHAEVVVPMDESKSDYHRLLSRAVDEISQAGGSAAQKMLETTLLRMAAALDTSTWQKESNLPSGMIRWSTGARLYEAVSATFAASAKSTQQPRRHHRQSSSGVAKAFLDEVRMGQTQVGSFIVTAHVPIMSEIRLGASSVRGPDVGSIPAAEIVTTLERALDASQVCLDEYRAHATLEPFEEAVTDGVSCELARALANLTLDGDCGIVLERAGDLIDAPRRTEFSFSAPDSQVFADVAERLFTPAEPRRVSVAGEVDILRRENDGTRRVHTIHLRVLDNNEIRSVRVQLSADQYTEAVEAHAQERNVRVSGQLEQRGNRKWITDPTIELLGADPGGGQHSQLRLDFEDGAEGGSGK